MYYCIFFFFFKQKTAYEMRISDWSSDVCSSDLQLVGQRQREPRLGVGRGLGAYGSGEAGFDVADLCGGRRLPQHLGHRGDALGSHALSPAMASPAMASPAAKIGRAHV